jgi:hypothetical protein
MLIWGSSDKKDDKTVHARNSQIGKSNFVCIKPGRPVAIVRISHPPPTIARAISAPAIE